MPYRTCNIIRLWEPLNLIDHKFKRCFDHYEYSVSPTDPYRLKILEKRDKLTIEIIIFFWCNLIPKIII